MRDLRLINKDMNAKKVVQTLVKDNPNATDDQDGYNLELEVGNDTTPPLTWV